MKCLVFPALLLAAGVAAARPPVPKGDAMPALTLRDRVMLKNKLKQVGLGFHNMESAFGYIEPAKVDQAGKPLLSWRVMALPYLEYNLLYQKFKTDEPWDSDHNKKVVADNPMPEVYELVKGKPNAKKQTHMQVFTGDQALFAVIRRTAFTKISDGLSNTLMAAVAAKPVPWAKPDDMAYDPKRDPRPLLLKTPSGYLTLSPTGRRSR